MKNLSVKEIINICRFLNFFPQRSSGQNFLFKKDIIREIVDSAELKKEDPVLEIGPGLGFMTEEIAFRAKEVRAVELDKRLANYLSGKFKNKKNIKIVNQDIFKINLKKYFKDSEYILISNLPYNITSLVIRNFLSQPPRPKKMILTIQKEVAERITAKPGEMSLLSVAAQYYSDPEIKRIIGPENFWPAPKIESALVAFNKIGRKKTEIDEKKFLRLVKAGFSAKRKKLTNNLKNGLDVSPEISEKTLKKMGLRPDLRPQDLSLENWLDLFKNLFDFCYKI